MPARAVLSSSVDSIGTARHWVSRDAGAQAR
jgi:hypothetical protein